MNRVFISYRRNDTGGYARAIYQHLVERLGLSFVFMDLEGLTPGYSFAEQLDAEIRDASLMLVLISKDWCGKRVDGTSRILEDEDFVRREVAAGLRLGVPVVPVLLGDAKLPQEGDLPDDVKQLLARHALTVTTARFDADLEPLVALSRKELGLATGLGQLRFQVERAGRCWLSPWGLLVTFLLLDLALLSLGANRQFLLRMGIGFESYIKNRELFQALAYAGGASLTSKSMLAFLGRFSAVAIGRSLRWTGWCMLLLSLCIVILCALPLLFPAARMPDDMSSSMITGVVIGASFSGLAAAHIFLGRNVGKRALTNRAILPAPARS